MWNEKYWYGMLTLTFFLTKQQTLWLRIAISSCDLESILNIIRPKEELIYVCDLSYNDVFKYLKSHWGNCDIELQQRMCLKHNWVQKMWLWHDWNWEGVFVTQKVS